MIDTSWVAWSPTDIARHTTDAIAARQAALSACTALPATARTFENTIVALESAGNAAADVQQVCQFLASVHPDASIRDAAQAAGNRMDEANVDVMHDRSIWDAVQQWKATGELERLEGPARKLAEDTIRDLKRVGFQLPTDQFRELRNKRVALEQLQTEFERAINEWDDAIEVEHSELAGLPERYIAGLKRAADGKYRVSLQYPDIIPFMDLAQADGPRRELASKNLRKGGTENMERLAEMIRLRQGIAGLLGYPTHADYVEEPRMAKDATTVRKFLARIIEQLQPGAIEQLKSLVAFKKAALGLTHPAPIHFHEVAYWSYRLKKERYGLDGEAVKAYFPLAKVTEGMMAMYQDILAVRFTHLPDATVWHPDVRAYAAHDAATGALLGHFFMDLHPRAGKFGHAAMFPLRLARTDAPVGMVGLVCNFPKPTATDPGLLDHDEVETFLHEFGHVMHALLSGGRWQSQNGMGVPLDFVEALSQIFEYWAWDLRALARLSGHWQTGEPLPAELLEKMDAVRREQGAMFYLAQAVGALYDLTIHARATDATVDAAELGVLHRAMRLEHERIDLPDDAIRAAGWGHMADYDAGYYGYLWSKVYAADMFTRFATDPLSPETGAAYRAQVLQPGASAPGTTLVRAFLNREPADAAFLAELGIS